MRTHLYTFVALIALGVSEGSLIAQCCDPDAFDYAGTGPCTGEVWQSDNGVCDPDCQGYSVCVEGSECYDANDPACTIPLDGGLSLLALAGGGLATAAMRRRREEEARQADES